MHMRLRDPDALRNLAHREPRRPQIPHPLPHVRHHDAAPAVPVVHLGEALRPSFTRQGLVDASAQVVRARQVSALRGLLHGLQLDPRHAHRDIVATQWLPPNLPPFA